MDQKRVLIVESDNGFALSIAAVLQEAGFASTIALSAADAQRELRERRPDLIVLRAELPDLSGFAFCGRLRKDKTAQGLPIILVSSDATTEALAQHRSHPQSAADGYLQMPFAMEEMLTQVTGLLSLTGAVDLDPTEEVSGRSAHEKPVGPADAQPASPNAVDDLEGALDGAFGLAGAAPQALPVEGQGVAKATFDPSAQIAGIEAMVPPPPPRPPRLPKRPRRSSVSDEDRQFLDRLFESIADRKAELLAESRTAPRRAPVKRELLATPEGKLQILREELNRRESQVARLSEIWGIRERELTSIDDKLHEKEVEIQGLKMQVDDLMRRLADARDLFIRKDQEHGAALDSMLLEKFVNEKELIEVVAAKEKDISLLRRDLHVREDDLQRRGQELDSGREEVSRLERARQDEFDQYANHLHDLEGKLARRETEILGLGSDLDEAVRSAQMVVDELTETKRGLDRERKQFAQSLETARAERDFDVRALQAQLEAETARAALAESEADAARARFEGEASALREELGLAEEQLSETQGERDSFRLQRDGVSQSLSARLQESEAAAVRLAQDLALEHEQAVAREAQLSSELSERAEQLGNLEGELEALGADKEARETELAAEIGQINQRLEGSNGEIAILARDLESARSRGEQLSEELDDLRRRTDAERTGATEAYSALERDRDHKLERAADELTQLRTELGDHIERLTGELERTAHELAETHEAREKREAELGEQLSEKVELVGSLEGELVAVRAHAKEREEALADDLVGMKRERVELEHELEAVRERAGTLGRDLDAATREQGRLLAEGDEYRARAEARAAELGGELSAREQAEHELEERSQAALEEMLTQRDALDREVKEKIKAIADWERRFSVLQVEKQRREEALAHEAQIRGEAGKASEKRLQSRLTEIEAQLKSAQDQLQSGQALERKAREEAEAASRKQQDLLQRFEKAERDRETQRREAQAALQTRDSKIGELGVQLQAAQQERRKVEEEGGLRVQRAEARAKELDLKAEQALQARDRIEREGQTGLQQRAKRIQDLEQALEAATAAKARAEKDLAARAQQAEAKAQDLIQRLATALRVQKDLEARLQKEGTEQSQRFKGELERREAQRQQEVARLQQALQEKSKQVKVMELDLQRLKQRGGPGPSPGSSVPKPGSPTSALPVTRKAPPPAPSGEGDLEISLEENQEATQIMQLPNLAQVVKPVSGENPEEDLDAMLDKLEI